MGATPDDASNQRWYVRRGEDVRGPYRWELIARNAGLGRIHAEDQLSHDREHWMAPADVLPRLPVPGALVGTSQDERRTERRHGDDEVGAEQRAGSDRRAVEEPSIVNRRARSERVWDSLRGGSESTASRMPLLAIALALSACLALAVSLTQQRESPVPDCDAVAASGVSWDFCAKPKQQLGSHNLAGMSARNAQLRDARLTNANLHAADFAYADLSRADLTLADARQMRLVGASLRHAVLNHARLTGADLSYADLSGASLVGAELSAARLSNTIWTDGRVCARDSIGVCNPR